jgi:hypothetical protein
MLAAVEAEDLAAGLAALIAILMEDASQEALARPTSGDQAERLAQVGEDLQSLTRALAVVVRRTSTTAAAR